MWRTSSKGTSHSEKGKPATKGLLSFTNGLLQEQGLSEAGAEEGSGPSKLLLWASGVLLGVSESVEHCLGYSDPCERARSWGAHCSVVKGSAWAAQMPCPGGLPRSTKGLPAEVRGACPGGCNLGQSQRGQRAPGPRGASGERLDRFVS